MIRRAAASVLGPGLVLAACAGPAATFDTAATERAIERVVRPRVVAEVDEVRCPSPIPRGDGESVTCRVVLADEAGSVRVRASTLGDGDGVAVDLLDAVVDPAQVGHQLHQALVAKYARTFTVDCGDDAALVARPGTTISCAVSDDGGRRKVTATVVDATGTLSFDLR